MGVTLRKVVFDIGGGIPDNKKFKAVPKSGDLQVDACPRKLWIR